MISPYSLNLLRLSINSAYYLGCIPFKIQKDPYSASLCIVKTTNSLRRKLLIYFGIFTSILYSIHIICQTYLVLNYAKRKNFNPHLKLGITVKMFYYMLGYNIHIFYLCHHWMHQKALSQLLQAFLSYYIPKTNNWENILGSSQRPLKRSRESTKSITGYVCVLLLITVQNIMVYKKKPQEVNFLTAWVPDPKHLFLGYRILFLMEYLHYLCRLWVNLKSKRNFIRINTLSKYFLKLFLG